MASIPSRPRSYALNLRPLDSLAHAQAACECILLTNASRYAPGSAPIDVRLSRVDGGAAEGGATAQAEISIQDYGRGIAAPDLAAVFTRFYQLGQESAAPIEELGLGLYITRKIGCGPGATVAAGAAPG